MTPELTSAPPASHARRQVMGEWHELGHTLRGRYSLDFSALTAAYEHEHFEWLYRSGWQGCARTHA
eukprot:7384070-Prymnesium_polylepis.1